MKTKANARWEGTLKEGNGNSEGDRQGEGQTR